MCSKKKQAEEKQEMATKLNKIQGEENNTRTFLAAQRALHVCHKVISLARAVKK